MPGQQRKPSLPGKLGKKRRHPQHLIDRCTVAELEKRFLEKGHGLTETQIKHVSRVSLGSLYTAPVVFQPRDSEENEWDKDRHVSNLSGTLTKLDPLTVFAIDGRRYVIDGHMRLDAYWHGGSVESRQIPVKHLPISDPKKAFGEALAYSARANSKDKLMLTLREKCEYAWKLVLYNETRQVYSLRDIEDATCVSKSAVANMAIALKENRPENLRDLTWEQVKRARRGDVERDATWEERETKRMGDAIWKAVSDTPIRMPEIFAAAVEERYQRGCEAIIERDTFGLVRSRAEEMLEFELGERPEGDF